MCVYVCGCVWGGTVLYINYQPPASFPKELAAIWVGPEESLLGQGYRTVMTF